MLAVARLCGPEVGMLGRLQVPSSFGEGGPPMIPPSMNLMGGVELETRSLMVRAEFGLTAFRSRK